MARKPYQSALIPYEDEIIALRHRRPPTSYARIADLLFQKYKLSVCRETIFRFVKVRSRGRKVYSYTRNASAEKVSICSGGTTARCSWFPSASRCCRNSRAEAA